MSDDEMDRLGGAGCRCVGPRGIGVDGHAQWCPRQDDPGLLRSEASHQADIARAQRIAYERRMVFSETQP